MDITDGGDAEDQEVGLQSGDLEAAPPSGDATNSGHARSIEWSAWIVVALGFLLFLLGGARFVLRHHFGFTDAVHCALAIVPAGVLLLVFDYVLHHAKLAAVILLVFAGLLLFTYPVFDIALGLTLIAAMAGPMLRDWKDVNRK